MRRSVLNTCLVVLVTSLAFINAADQNTITYDNKTSQERTTLKEQEEIHSDVLRHITTTSTTVPSFSDTSTKPHASTVSKLLTTPRSIAEEEQLQKILEDTDTTTKSNNEDKIQIHEKYERKLTVNENGGRETESYSPQLTNKTSTNEVIDVVTYKYNESGQSSSVSSFVTVSHVSSYEHSSSVVYIEDDEDDHTPEYHSVSTKSSNDGTDNDENNDEDNDDDVNDDEVNEDDDSNNNNGNNDGASSKNYVNNNEQSRVLLKDVVPVIDLNTSITDKKYTISNVNNDVTVNNKLRPDALDEKESTTNFSISSSNNSSNRSSISKGIISLENINSTHSSNGDSVNQSINSIINNNNVNIDEHSTLKPRLRYSVRKSEESTLSNISYNSSDNAGLQSSTTNPNLIKLDTINTVPVMEWERIPNVVVNRTSVNSTTNSNNTAYSQVPSSVTQLPSISSIVKPSIAFKSKLRLHPTIRIKTTSPTPMDLNTELLSNSSNESMSEEQSIMPFNSKYNLNSTIKTSISSRKRPPKYYYLLQSNSSDLTIPPTATAWALASMLDNNSRVMKKSSPIYTTTQQNLKNDASSEKPITTPSPRVKSFIPWSTRLQTRITTESTLSEDVAEKFLHTDSEISFTSNADIIQEIMQFNNTAENTTRSFLITNSSIPSLDHPINNASSSIIENTISDNITKSDGIIMNDQSSVLPYSSSSTTEGSNAMLALTSDKVIANKSETESNSSETRDTIHEQSSTYSYYTKAMGNSDTLSLDSHMTTAEYYGSSESTAPIIALSSSPVQNDTKNNVTGNYDFSNGTEMKTVNYNEDNGNKTGSNLMFDMNQTSNEIRSNETLKFKTPSVSVVVEGEMKNNNTVNEPAEVMTEDTILDSGLQANEDSEEDGKNNETTVIHILDLPLETTTNTEVAAEEDINHEHGDNEDEELHNIIIKTTTPTEAINQDVNIADLDSGEDTVDDKKTNKDIMDTNEDKTSNKSLITETTEKPNIMNINWYNVSVQTAEDTQKDVYNTTKTKEPVTAEAEHPQTTPVIIITTSSSSSETPTTSTTTTTTTAKPSTVADTTSTTTEIISTSTATSAASTTTTPTTSTSSTASTTTTTTTATTTSTSTSTSTTPSTTTTHIDESLHIVEDLPAYISLHVETSLAKLCRDRQKLKQAIVNLFRSKSERRISESQVILLNVNKQQCINVTKSEDTLLPVNILLVDEVGQYDTDLMDKCLQLFKDVENSGFDMYFTVHKVGLVMQRMAPPVADKGSVIAAIALSFIAAVCLLLLGILLVVIRKRQKGFNYGQRCTPVSLDDYSLDNISVYNSVRRKGALRASKRSYGNPAFDDPGAPSHSMNFAGLANFSSDIEALHEEFNQIPMITVKPDELPPGAETKNRYANVIPLPETRVQLIGKEGCDHLDEYINANFVKGPKGAEKFYIACQAPMQSTVNDFWKMIWQQQCKVILMLTDLQENGVEKCADYLPPCEVLDCHRLFGDFQVTLKKREEREKYVISSLQLKNLETNSWREVMHLWYASWPTQGVPEDCSSIIAFLIEARSFMRSTTGPTVVHCSPGTGRTGTVIAIDICIRDFETTRSVDIPKTVYAIRRDRAGAVQTKDQYTFIYQVLNLYAAKLTGGALDSF